MRRHYRNHARRSFSESRDASEDIRGRGSGDAPPRSHPSSGGLQSSTSPPNDSMQMSSSEDSDAEMILGGHFMEEDETDERVDTSNPRAQCHLDSRIRKEKSLACSRQSNLSRPSQEDHGHTLGSDYAQLRMPPASASSPRSSGRAPDRMYTSSSPVYARSCTDLKVSTVLRPAFNPLLAAPRSMEEEESS
jgi:hypothetical protein